VRRILSTVTVLATVLLMLGGLGPSVLAAEHTNVEEHPIVGAWVIQVETDCLPDRPCPPPLLRNMAILDSDGWATIAYGQGVAVGSWQPTGERTADMTFRFHELNKKGNVVGLGILLSSAEVAEDGQSFTATGTVEFPGLFDTEGQFGPFPELSARRIAVESMAERGESVGAVVPQYGKRCYRTGSDCRSTPWPIPNRAVTE
jgi:hypothetical protein